MNTRKLLTGIAALLLMWCAPAMASEVDILIRKLVEHGVLTQEAADDILQETRAEAEKERTETIAATKEALLTGTDAPFMLADAIPSWIRNTTIKGDFRLRYQMTNREGSTDRHRGRYRLRLGFITKINDKVDIGYGLATGDSNPRSTNQDFTNSFETPDIRLDYAYASYRPFDWMKLIGGKMPNPLWLPGGSYLWDSDIRPEGVTAALQHKVGVVELFLTTGFWVLDEVRDDSNDPTMWVFQPGCRVNLGTDAYFKNAVTLYEFANVKGGNLDYTSRSNTRNPDGTYAKDYSPVVVSGELGTRTGISLIPFAAVYGEYITNRKVGRRDSGYACGIRFGHEKVKKGLWQAGLHYQRLERDAWLDVFPDADVYGGQTNTQAYLLKFTYGLMDNVDFATNYYRSRPLSGLRQSEDNLQVEVNFKF